MNTRIRANRLYHYQAAMQSKYKVGEILYRRMLSRAKRRGTDGNGFCVLMKVSLICGRHSPSDISNSIPGATRGEEHTEPQKP